MKKAALFWYSLPFVFLSGFSCLLVIKSMTNVSFSDSFSSIFDKNIFLGSALHENSPEDVAAGMCSSESKSIQTSMVSDSDLQELAKYESVCNSLVTKTVAFSISVDFGGSSPLLLSQARALSGKLNEFSSVGVKPVVLVSPAYENQKGDVSSYFASMASSESYKNFFLLLKSLGVTDQEMGLWIFLPEANLPNWDHKNISSSDFSNSLNKFFTDLKMVFPYAQGGVLLNAATYETDNFDWTDREYASLIPYVKDIRPGLIDNFGIEGFPWMPTKDSGSFGVLDSREYLNPRLAMEAADKLGIKKITFFTGTFSKKYTLDVEKQVIIDPGDRKDILNGIISEVSSTEKKGFDVAISLLVSDESSDFSATDWSYWNNSSDTQDPNQFIFKDFVSKMNGLGIPFALNFSRE